MNTSFILFNTQLFFVEGAHYMDFGANMKLQRKKCGYTQRELGEKLNVTFQAVSRWENNDVEPSIETIKKMKDIFNCSYDELFKDE